MRMKPMKSIASAAIMAFFASPVNASADSSKNYPANVNCQLSLDSALGSNSATIEEVARSCNEFNVQNELEFNLVKGACILGGTLSGLVYSFSDGMCQSESAAALCRVPIDSIGREEVTWYFEPNTPQNDTPSHEDKFRASCDDLSGSFESLR